jgi:predicted nucleic acid-binding protein
MILVFSLLQGHPANLPCEQLLRSEPAWFTSPLVLIEAKNILTKAYGIDAGIATGKLLHFAAGPIVLLDLDQSAVAAALSLADSQHLGLTDAVLLYHAQQQQATVIATEDQALAQACTSFNIKPVSPLDAGLRQQIAAWEAINLAPKGMPRILRRVHDWLNQAHPQAGKDFWSQTGGGNHLP